MTDLGASSKRIKLDDVETPPTAQENFEAGVYNWCSTILFYQNELEKKSTNGAAFLAEMQQPALPMDVSAAGAIVKHFKSFNDDKWSDNALLGIHFYITSKDGAGACHDWLHARLKGLTCGSDCAWDTTCTQDCIMLVLRYVTATPAMIEQGNRIVKALEEEAEWVAKASKLERRRHHQFELATGRWSHIARDFLATLDADPYWAAHPIDKK